MTALLARSPDRIDLPAPAGVRLFDSAARAYVASDLDVVLAPAAGQPSALSLQANPSGFWVNQALLGAFRSFSNNRAVWPAQARAYNIAVDDPRGQYLPLRLSEKLPKSGALVWQGWPALAPAALGPLLPPSSAPGTKPPYLPLFPTSAYSAGPLARVYARLALRESGGKRTDAAWALLTVSIGTSIIGIGLADAHGAIGIYFPYPLIPALPVAQAVNGRTQVSWDAAIAVHCDNLGEAGNTALVPDLAAILNQLTKPARKALKTIAGNQPALPAQTLMLGRALVLRSENAPGQFASSLYLKSP